jgi:hypothetical protein
VSKTKIEKTLYLVSSELQENEVKKYCFGKCKKICLGALLFDGFYWYPCWETHCPYKEREAEMGLCEVPTHGKVNVILRKMQERPK